MNKWHSESFGDLTINFDSVRIPVKEADRQSGPYPYYGASGVVDYTDNFLFDGEYLLIAEDGENLRTRNTPIAFIVNGKFWVNNHAHIVTGNDNADTRFLLYALLSLDISSYLTGSTMPKLTQGNLNNISLLVPPLPEQRRIAHILGTLDDKIENNRKMAKTLEAMAQAIFQSWFVDFDPVRAKMAGESPESICKRLKLTPEILDLFPDRLVDSELGEIPEGWEVKTLGELVNMVKGRSYKSDELSVSETALVTLKSFARGGGYRVDGLKPYTGTYKPEQLLLSGDILIACTDVTQAAEVIGRPITIRKNARYHNLVASLDTIIVRSATLSLNSTYLYYLCATDLFVSHANTYVTGTTVLHLGKEAIPSFKLAIPAHKLVDVFQKVAMPLLKQNEVAETENEHLESLRDTLLPKLISGEIRVPEAEHLIEEASG
ncbi:MAG: restriction endonuclease subunit S [Acidithiobacillus ferrooxidans]